MTFEPRFLTLSEVMEIHDQEIAAAGGLSGIRDLKGLESALGALASSLTFLFMNGYEIEELYDEELADKTIELVRRKIAKSDLTQHLKNRSKEIN